MPKTKFPVKLSIFLVLLAGTASWALYALIREGLGRILKYFGVSGDLMQLTIIFILLVVILTIAGWKLEDIIKT